SSTSSFDTLAIIRTSCEEKSALTMNLPFGATNIFRASSGWFCRFGYCDENRPVTVPFCLYVACNLPLRFLISFGNASIYVYNNFVFSRYLRSSAMTVHSFTKDFDIYLMAVISL